MIDFTIHVKKNTFDYKIVENILIINASKKKDRMRIMLPGPNWLIDNIEDKPNHREILVFPVKNTRFSLSKNLIVNELSVKKI